MQRKILIVGSRGFVGSSLCDWFVSSTNDELHGTTSRMKSDQDEESSYFLENWDVRNVCTLNPDFDVIVNCAVPASAELNVSHPEIMLDVNIRGMQNIIEFASRHKNPPRVVLTSSGAVYGELPNDLEYFSEDCLLACSTTNPYSAYAEGKRVAELLLTIANAQGLCTGIIARLFAFSGTRLPRNRHFAIGNFVRDAVNDRKIDVFSDGLSLRTYLDQNDMSSWLGKISLNGSAGSIYHVGSERVISIGQLAELVARRASQILDKEVMVKIHGKQRVTDGVSRYVPRTSATRLELNLHETVTLEESIDSMILSELRDR
jgi:nucleoside-diphosphate-sugar epimerase